MSKRIIIIVIGVFGIYFLSLFSFGKGLLVNQLVKDNNTTINTYEWTDDIYIVSNIRNVETNLNVVGSMFKLSSKKVKFIPYELDSTFNKYVHAEDAYYYFLMLEKFGPYVKINETEWVNEYSASWKKEYIWCFFFWIKIEDEMIGIS